MTRANKIALFKAMITSGAFIIGMVIINNAGVPLLSQIISVFGLMLMYWGSLILWLID